MNHREVQQNFAHFLVKISVFIKLTSHFRYISRATQKRIKQVRESAETILAHFTSGQ